MISARNQRTIAGPAVVEGFGYWSGRDVRVEFRTAEVGTGIVFVRSDLPGQPRVPARVENRVDMPRRSSLCHDGVMVEMVEHVMAALAGLRIDNCEVWTTAPEMPGCDGSAAPFVRALDAAGIVEQDAPRPQRVVTQGIRVDDGSSWFEARPGPPDVLLLKYHLDYGPDGPIGRQTFEIALSPDSFRTQLAPCRTFMLKQEADWLLAQGLGRRVRPCDLLVFDQHGPIDNQLRFPDECVRHKLLDMVGDLALGGCDLVGRLVAYRSGHRLNAEMLRAIQAQTPCCHAFKRCA